MKNKHGIEILPDKGHSGQRKKILRLAGKHNWIALTYQKNIGMLSFVKGEQRVNIYYTKMTVATCVEHPKQGKTQLFRRNVSLEELEKIFINPRVHTRKGYYTRR